MLYQILQRKWNPQKLRIIAPYSLQISFCSYVVSFRKEPAYIKLSSIKPKSIPNLTFPK